VVNHSSRRNVVLKPGRHPSQLIALLHDDLGLVDGQPGLPSVEGIEQD
jgi:hypothetical protein